MKNPIIVLLVVAVLAISGPILVAKFGVLDTVFVAIAVAIILFARAFVRTRRH